MYCVCARSETTALALLLESCLRVPTRVCSPARCVSVRTALALLLESCLRVPTRVCSPASVFVR